MKTDECLARARRVLVQSAEQVKAISDAEIATVDLVRKSRVVIAAARRTMAANPPSRPPSSRRRSR
jgi:hypothetical protein